MSQRSDKCLSLCLEQASKSPLHYRHGCIVVRGGKVIGQGFNDYRNGFNGGALKTGQLASVQATNASDDTPIKLKSPEKKNQKSEHSQQRQFGTGSQHVKRPSPGKSFQPFELVGGGQGGGTMVNTPLSMHSEMMAIQNALAAASTSSSRAFSYQKPCFKLPADSKRKQGLRRKQLEQYVERVCKGAEARSAGRSPQDAEQHVQGSSFGEVASQPGNRGREKLEGSGRGRGDQYMQRRSSGQLQRRCAGTVFGEGCSEILRSTDGEWASPQSDPESSSSSSQPQWTTCAATASRATSNAAPGGASWLQSVCA